MRLYNQAGTHKNKMKGTGLGLGIVKKLVQRLNGEIQVESIEKSGTTFKVSFDFPKASEEDLKTVEKSYFAIKNLDNLFKGKSILIVDDDVLITNLYAKIIAPTNARVVTYNNPELALQEVGKETFDLLIIDYKMPEMSGYDFLNQMKNRIPGVSKSIVSTANTLLTEEDKQKLNTFDEIVFKPIKKDDFLNNIAAIMGFQPQKIERDLPLPIQEEALNFSSLKNYIGDDVNDLIEILEVTTEENDSSLSKMENAIQESNHEEIAFIIHQLSSRFVQVDNTLTKNTKELESKLNKEQVDFPTDAVKTLYEFWYNGNDKIKKALFKLKGENE